MSQEMILSRILNNVSLKYSIITSLISMAVFVNVICNFAARITHESNMWHFEWQAFPGTIIGLNVM